MSQFLTVREISETYKVNVQTVYGWISHRLFPVVKLNGKLVRIPKDSFEQWVERRKSIYEERGR